MTRTWDIAGSIASSRYRRAVCEHLLDHGPSLPSDIAAETGLAQPHVSRALSELRAEDAVALLVPESQQKGRLYGLTPAGRIAIRRLRDGDGEPTVSAVDAASFPYERLLEFLRTRYGRHLRVVAASDSVAAEIHLVVLDEGREVEAAGRALVAALHADELDRSDAPGESPAGDYEFAVHGLGEATLVRVRVDGDRLVGIAFDASFDEPIRSFATTCRDHLP